MGLNKSLKQIKLENVPKGILPVKQMPVRTTFRLSKGGHDAIKYISEFYNINNTEVFDRLVSLFQEIKRKMIAYNHILSVGKLRGRHIL